MRTITYISCRNTRYTHTGEKAHKCNQCLPCVHALSFKIQMRAHMWEKSCKCSQCDYTCTRVANLHMHMLTHTEVNPFNCDQCFKIFTRKSYLIKHSLSQAQMYEHKEPTILTMRSPWFDYQQRIFHAPCLWVGFLKPKHCVKTSYFLLNDAMF